MKVPKNLEEANSYIGKKIRITGNVAGRAGYTNAQLKGKTGYITMIGWGNPCYFYTDISSKSSVSGSVYLTASNFEIVAETKAEIEKELKKLRTEFKKNEKELKDKLDFMKETGFTEYDEMEFKAYKTLSIIEGESSKIQKAKLIAELINS